MIINKQYRFVSVLLTVIFLSILFHSCFKDLPTKTIVYQNDFESSNNSSINVYNYLGRVDTPAIATFNGGHVLGRFNNNLVSLKIRNLPKHRILKIAFDLYIHDKWDGDYIAPGNGLPDAWLMEIDNFPLYVTTFSNSSYRQSYPGDYVVGGFKFPPKADAWGTNFPGACALKDSANGTTLYKIEKTTSNTGDSIVLTMHDVLQPRGNDCLKSWSIDNVVLTVSSY